MTNVIEDDFALGDQAELGAGDFHNAFDGVDLGDLIGQLHVLLGQRDDFAFELLGSGERVRDLSLQRDQGNGGICNQCQYDQLGQK